MPWDDYSKLKEIGSGSFGRAYLVQTASKVDKKLLVMKEIDVSKMGALERSNAEVEVKVLSSLKHPYIVRYWESFVHDRHLCIIMDYCEGGDLFQYVHQCKKTNSTVKEEKVLRWFTQLSLGLKYIHDRHVLHRDIKTANVFLSRKDDSSQTSVKIADFGISKVVESSHSLARTMVGTPYYLSPEICQKQPYAFPSDVWALGCVLFELCALRVPFDAQDLEELVKRVVKAADQFHKSDIVQTGLQKAERMAARAKKKAAAVAEEAKKRLDEFKDSPEVQAAMMQAAEMFDVAMKIRDDPDARQAIMHKAQEIVDEATVKAMQLKEVMENVPEVKAAFEAAEQIQVPEVREAALAKAYEMASKATSEAIKELLNLPEVKAAIEKHQGASEQLEEIAEAMNEELEDLPELKEALEEQLGAATKIEDIETRKVAVAKALKAMDETVQDVRNKKDMLRDGFRGIQTSPEVQAALTEAVQIFATVRDPEGRSTALAKAQQAADEAVEEALQQQMEAAEEIEDPVERNTSLVLAEKMAQEAKEKIQSAMAQAKQIAETPRGRPPQQD
eukprot:gnl/TRDRNA2_/TRDRNA2_171423_c0_seq4.p1 gnl/TRDRNA2_/TRDRNA2_171423_c0~~gnl/TRDRNA2_/TRDRNA2_171423_c0_seq4.p1  ORF type:complete len:561 (-),score=171.51 gnl/TRDRNA2_/TRDRNA2_171423_c0_seq4:141-1823(-)